MRQESPVASREFCYNTAVDRAKELKAVGARIRKLREAKGISQEDAARLASTDRSYYGRIEREAGCCTIP